MPEAAKIQKQEEETHLSRKAKKEKLGKRKKTWRTVMNEGKEASKGVTDTYPCSEALGSRRKQCDHDTPRVASLPLPLWGPTWMRPPSGDK